MSTLVFWAFLRHHANLRCCHGKWAPSLIDYDTDQHVQSECFCVNCDTGMST